MLLTKTNITSGVYFHNHLCHGVVCLPVAATAAGGAQGVVGLVFREWTQGWSMELTCFHGLNRVSYDVFTGGKRTPLVRA